MQAVKARQMLKPIFLRAARKVGGKHIGGSNFSMTIPEQATRTSYAF